MVQMRFRSLTSCSTEYSEFVWFSKELPIRSDRYILGKLLSIKKRLCCTGGSLSDSSSIRSNVIVLVYVWGLIVNSKPVSLWS